jgi:hypothetical protein
MSILFRNKPFETVRLTYTTFILGEEVTYFSEGRGTRYYYSLISSTNSTPAMEASTFESFLSFTMSNYNVRDIDVIPMEPGELVVIESTATAINTNGTKAYTNKAYGSYRHSGSQLKIVGGTSSFTYSVSTDFTGVDLWFGAWDRDRILRVDIVATGTSTGFNVTIPKLSPQSSGWEWVLRADNSGGEVLAEGPFKIRAKPVKPV